MFGSGIWKGKVKRPEWTNNKHHSDVIMGTMASQITSLTIVYNNRLERRRSKKTSKLRVTGLCEGIHRWPVNSPHKGPVTRKMFPFDDVIMITTAPLISRNIIFKLWQLPKRPWRECYQYDVISVSVSRITTGMPDKSKYYCCHCPIHIIVTWQGITDKFSLYRSFLKREWSFPWCCWASFHAW